MTKGPSKTVSFLQLCNNIGRKKKAGDTIAQAVLVKANIVFKLSK